jgi:hypothetical protein
MRRLNQLRGSLDSARPIRPIVCVADVAAQDRARHILLALVTIVVLSRAIVLVAVRILSLIRFVLVTPTAKAGVGNRRRDAQREDRH